MMYFSKLNNTKSDYSNNLQKRHKNVLCCCFDKKRRMKMSGPAGYSELWYTGVTTQHPGLAQMVHLMDSRKPLDLNPHTDH
jgi:hypothetical protein